MNESDNSVMPDRRCDAHIARRAALKLVSFRKKGPVCLGILKADQVVDVSGASDNLAGSPMPASMSQLLARGASGLEAFRQLSESASETHAMSEVEMLAPVHDAGKVICIGLNYKDHAEESGAAVPDEPIIFSKYTSALLGHGGEIELPSVSEEVDYEAELVAVIGKNARHVSREDAWSYVAGYACGHDVSARDWQLRKPGGQWMMGKTFDTFGPMGPALVTSDEVSDPHNLAIRFRLNGKTMQDSSTCQLIFGVDEAISYLSGVFTLEPGDVIFTGTPPGVGMARKPPVFLANGDVAEVEIEGLGTLRNTVVGS